MKTTLLGSLLMLLVLGLTGPATAEIRSRQALTPWTENVIVRGTSRQIVAAVNPGASITLPADKRISISIMLHPDPTFTGTRGAPRVTLFEGCVWIAHPFTPCPLSGPNAFCTCTESFSQQTTFLMTGEEGIPRHHEFLAHGNTQLAYQVAEGYLAELEITTAFPRVPGIGAAEKDFLGNFTATAGFQARQWFGTGMLCAATPVAVHCASLAGIIGGSWTLAGLTAGILAMDPLDPNYTLVAPATVPAGLTWTNSGISTIDTPMQALMSAFRETIATGRAWSISHNRWVTAIANQAPGAEALQRSAMQTYRNRFLTAQALLGPRALAVRQALGLGPLTATQEAQARAQLLAQGLPAKTKSLLTNAGLAGDADWALTLVAKAAAAGMGPGLSCDVNGDDRITLADINLILAARNQSVSPGDVRDVDGDGVVTALDARVCVTRCTDSRCQ